MSTAVQHHSCPVCRSTNILPMLAVKDHTVSGEVFEVWSCGNCTLQFTQAAPDESTIAPYYKSENYISHTDSGKGLINQLYKQVRKYTLRIKARLLKQQLGKRNGNVLDIGCGTGAFINELQHQGWNVKGLEPDNHARGLAMTLYGIEARPVTELFKLETSSYDAITMWHVLEHVHRLHEYIAQIGKLLKPSGKFFIAVPNHTSLDAQLYGTSWAAYDVPRHLYHFTPPAVNALVGQHGMKVTALRPMWFDAFYISLLSSRYQKGKVSYAGALLSGMRSNLNALHHTTQCSSLIYIVSKV